MANVLNIDTSGSISFIALAIDGNVAGIEINESTKDHATFIHPAIKRVLAANQLEITDLDSIAAVAGPGSYTGIRVGMASAKGLCMALNKPLITVNMLRLMAFEACSHVADINALLCPMIDARRMEVFMAVYDNSLAEIVSPVAFILDEDVVNLPHNKPIYVFGSGAFKSLSVVKFRTSVLIQNVNLPSAMCMLTHQMHIQKTFTSLINSEPLYLKAFHNNG